ncbi:MULTISPECIES: hypothetical protein [Fischerella]|uniref:hypothetical protein n=1 Tax=Fischerella TaxID=1190 RepID=UPI0002F71C82|nr:MULTISPECIES: hypothetical protein [Fischerella]MBD2430006.1 hypothetical protein [Fischerella sp. FACHB-380]
MIGIFDGITCVAIASFSVTNKSVAANIYVFITSGLRITDQLRFCLWLDFVISTIGNRITDESVFLTYSA